MATSFIKTPWLALFSLTVFSVGVSAQVHAQTSPPRISLPRPADQVRALAMTSLTEELKEIQEMVKDGERSKLVDVASEAEEQIKLRGVSEEDVTVGSLKVQRDIVRNMSGNTNRLLGGVQTALITAAENTDVKKLVQGESSEPVVVTENLAGSVFNIQVTYVREGEGDEAVLKRQVDLVSKSNEELENSEDATLQSIAKGAKAAADKDPRFEPVLKEAVDAVTEQVAGSVDGFLSESEVKISDIKDDEVPVETNLATNEEALASAVGASEKEVTDELARAERKRDVASEEDEAETERLRAKKLFADWAIDNAEEAKKLNECQMAEKVMELNPDLEFDMLEEKIRTRCKDLAAREEERNKRDVLGPEATRDVAADAANRNLLPEQERQKIIEQFMGAVQACVLSNDAATNSIDQIKKVIKPAYDAISGFDQLEAALRSSATAQSVLARMLSDGLDAETAAIDSRSVIEGLFADSESGNTDLFDERKKLARLEGRLAMFVDEYNKRSEQMGRAVGELEQRNMSALIARAQAGDQEAIGEMNRRAQQGLPTDPVSAYQAGYRGQIMEREQDPNHLQQTKYLQVVRGAYLQADRIYKERESRHRTNGGATWVGSQSSTPMLNTAQRVLNNSPALRSNPNIAVGNALSGNQGGLTGQGVGGGTLRSTGAAAPVQTIRQPASNNQPNRAPTSGVRR
jgi:hypothetical protein